jgi:dipeptidyl aminopeptidase/acylaminoacyl peptidase
MSTIKQVKPFGTWPSPISISMLSRRSGLTDVQWTPDGKALVWQETRAGEGVLVAQPLGEAPRDLLSEHSVRGGVLYGGGGFGLGRQAVFFAERSGQLMRRDLWYGRVKALTPLFGAVAAPTVSPDGNWVAYVHTDNRNDVLALVDANGQHWPRQLVQGADFYMQPAWHPSGERVAWVEWDLPNMPWDETRIYMAKFCPETQTLSKKSLIAGGEGQVAVQPLFSPDGHWLSYIESDGDWERLVLYNLAEDTHSTVLSGDQMLLSTPVWGQGQRTCGWSYSSERLFIIRNFAGKAELLSVGVNTGNVKVIDTSPFTWLDQLSVSPVNDELALVASSPQIPDHIIRWDGEQWRTVAFSDTLALAPEELSPPEAVSWQSLDGEIVHGFYYPPANQAWTNPGAPPLIVYPHGGPNSQSVMDFPRHAPFFTSRGYAWLMVNYRGSSGYGRSYLNNLYGRWGDLDSQDAVSGAQAMAQRGLADGKRLAIFGGSAGGFTVLNALIQHPEVFKAGIALYPVTNLFTADLETHKFESRYTEKLCGVLPDAAEKYKAWSPVYNAGAIKAALAIFHGTDDKAVAPSQSQEIAARLREKGVPHLFKLYEGEGHGFKKPETLLDLYAQIERFLTENLLFAP